MGQPVVHFEFWSRDPDKSSSFYTDVFGWEIRREPGLNYWLVDTKGEGGVNGGMFQPQEGPLPALLSIYIQVDDVQKYLDAAQEKGAKVVVPPMEIPGVGWSAIFLDPEERAIGLFKPLEKSS